ncbi:MAG: hypothetical protein PUB93_01380 [Firmicutes bacterium]|nr:hypothetical protein [Bacillota bacterium]
MNGWLSTILFSVCALFSVPAWLISHKVIHRLYFNHYNPLGLWDTYYTEMENMQFAAVKIILCICVLAFLFFVVSSFLLMRKGKPRKLLSQALLSQSVILLWQIGLVVISGLAAFVSLLNLIGAVLTLPLLILLVITLELFLTFAGAIRGIAGILALRRCNCLSAQSTLLHCVLQFLPIISIIDNLYLHSKTTRDSIS